MPINKTALDEFNKELNSYANVREYLMTFTTNMAIMTANSIKLQSSSLAQLTKATNQLTRNSLVNFNLVFFFFLEDLLLIEIDDCIREMLSIIGCFTFDINKNFL
jgi:hypothetical protein